MLQFTTFHQPQQAGQDFTQITRTMEAIEMCVVNWPARSLELRSATYRGHAVARAESAWSVSQRRVCHDQDADDRTDVTLTPSSRWRLKIAGYQVSGIWRALVG